MSEEYQIGVAEFHNHTLLHPVGLGAVLSQGVALLFVPRRYAVLPMILVACLIPSAQRVAVMGLDFTLLRILILFAWARVLMRKEWAGVTWNRLDTMVLCWMLSGTLIYTFQNGTSAAFINRCGWMFDGLGMYFFFRCTICEWEDLDRLIQGFCLVGIIVAGAFFVESRTGRNAFSVFGGVPEITMVREGRLRCQGAFAHPILAGCFWASVMPWMVAYYFKGKRWLAVAGLFSAAAIVMMCSSSTPVLALAFSALALALYPIRRNLRIIRWTFVAILIFLHLSRDKPVWHLISRVNVVGGSTGWHRYVILDSTIANFHKWWLIGENNVASWGVWEMRDITNQYILEALQGGLLTLILYISSIVVAFQLVGKGIRSQSCSVSNTMLIWCIGSSLFCHVCIYFAVSYFGQIVMLWYLNLAMAGSIGRMMLGGNSNVSSVINSAHNCHMEMVELHVEGQYE